MHDGACVIAEAIGEACLHADAAIFAYLSKRCDDDGTGCGSNHASECESAAGIAAMLDHVAIITAYHELGLARNLAYCCSGGIAQRALNAGSLDVLREIMTHGCDGAAYIAQYDKHIRHAAYRGPIRTFGWLLVNRREHGVRAHRSDREWLYSVDAPWRVRIYAAACDAGHEFIPLIHDAVVNAVRHCDLDVLAWAAGEQPRGSTHMDEDVLEVSAAPAGVWCAHSVAWAVASSAKASSYVLPWLVQRDDGRRAVTPALVRAAARRGNFVPAVVAQIEGLVPFNLCDMLELAVLHGTLADVHELIDHGAQPTVLAFAAAMAQPSFAFAAILLDRFGAAFAQEAIDQVGVLHDIDLTVVARIQEELPEMCIAQVLRICHMGTRPPRERLACICAVCAASCAFPRSLTEASAEDVGQTTV